MSFENYSKLNHSFVPVSELSCRMKRFKAHMDEIHPDWELSAIFGRINLYYLTGTIQDGMLLIPRDEDPVLWVRRSYERAMFESAFPDIRSMSSFKDAAKVQRKIPDTIFLETELVPVALLERFKKYFPCNIVKSLDTQISYVRSVKSPYELNLMEKAGKIHEHVLETLVPQFLVEGMSEIDLSSQLYSALLDEGHHGVVRFGRFQTEMLIGQLGFGESSLYPTSFDGPGGNYGMSPAVPILGSRSRKLKTGDLVFVDVGCGVDGYHTDKTMTYMFGKSLPDSAIHIHQQCVDIQNDIVSMLRPGIAPSFIYDTIMDNLDPEFLSGFMGYKERQVKFLGHGIGLLI